MNTLTFECWWVSFPFFIHTVVQYASCSLLAFPKLYYNLGLLRKHISAASFFLTVVQCSTLLMCHHFLN